LGQAFYIDDFSRLKQINPGYNEQILGKNQHFSLFSAKKALKKFYFLSSVKQKHKIAN
jgi:hypothetical protein